MKGYTNCGGCHSNTRVSRYLVADWAVVVGDVVDLIIVLEGDLCR